MILDLDGTIRLSTLAGARGDRPGGRAVLRATDPRTRPSRTSTPRTSRGRPTITVATPLFDQNGGGQRVAVLAANLSLERLDRIILERTGLGETGRTYLVGARRPAHPERMNTGADARRRRTRPGSTTRSRGQQRPGPVRRRPRRARSSASTAGCPSAGGLVAEISPGRGVRVGPPAGARRSACVGLALGAPARDRHLRSSPGASPGRSSTLAATATRVRRGDLEATVARDPSEDEVGHPRGRVRRDDRRSSARTSRPSSGGSTSAPPS